MRILKRVLSIVLIVVVVLAAVVVVNTLRSAGPPVVSEAIPAPAVTPEALRHFQAAVGYQTISYADPTRFDSTQFLGFRRFLETTYPLFHQRTERHTLEGYSLVYKWQGQDSSLAPVVLMAHQDVVPIEEATRTMWTVDPFAATIKDEFIWGRGTTDDKINLISQLEAAEKLMREGMVPPRTVYFVFGHDEEIGGKGAIAVAAWMKAQNLTAEFILDEGGIITKDKLPGAKAPVALLGTAEKGYMSVTLTVAKPGGHSSMPDSETAIDILSKAVVRLRATPFEARMTEPLKGLMAAAGPVMPWLQRMAFANSWLFEPLVMKTYEKTGSGNAMIRTTFVPTILEGGLKDNVIPTVAKATANLRLLPGDNSQAVLARLNEIVADPRVKIELFGPLSEASPVTSAQGFGFTKIAAAVRKAYPQVVAAPFLMIGATDSRHFTGVSDNIIKFSPMVDPIGFHGIDERVSLESFQTALWFYEQLLRDL
jgi:carboxypeptidase PM20D1